MVKFAMLNSPLIQMSELDAEIGNQQIKSALSAWFPQVAANTQWADNLKLQTTVIGDQFITLGQPYSGNVNLTVDQSIFNRDVFLASKGTKLARTQLSHTLETQKIEAVDTVA
jgi:outer membrane protein TolC